jgi:hypothetical protein
MTHDSSSLFSCELLGFAHNVRDRTVNFSDVMKQGDSFHCVLHSLVGISNARKSQGVIRNPAHVRSGFRIVCIDCVEQTLERRGAKPLERKPLLAFLVIQNASRRACKEWSVSEHCAFPRQ